LSVGALFCIVAILLISTTLVKAQELPELPSIENAKVDITIEARSDGKCHFEVRAEGPPMEGLETGLAELPVTGGSLNIGISSPTLGQLCTVIGGSATFRQPMDSEIIAQVTQIVEAYTMMPDTTNSMLLQQAQSALKNAKDSLPPELQDLEISDMRITKLVWSQPELEAGLSITLGGDMFENEELRTELPINIDVTLSVSTTKLTLDAELNGKNVDGRLKIVLSTEQTTLDLDITFELPRVDDRIHWDLKVPETGMIAGLENVLGGFIEKNELTLTLKVPADASVSDLPPGYTQEGSTYSWSGDSAVGAFDKVLRGEAKSGITYGYNPPAEFPWLVVGALVVVAVVVAVAVIALRRR
jgi:hypothetical protein